MMSRNKVLYARKQPFTGFFVILKRSINHQTPLLTQQCLFLWHGYVCRGSVPCMPLTCFKGTFCLWSLTEVAEEPTGSSFRDCCSDMEGNVPPSLFPGIPFSIAKSEPFVPVTVSSTDFAEFLV